MPSHKVFYNYVKDRGSGEAELYDLSSDLGETRNLAREKPQVVTELRKLADEFQWPEKLFDNTIGLPKAKLDK